MYNNLTSFGILIILIGFALVVVGALTSPNKDAKVAVGGFIGFIPFGFGNDKQMVWSLIVLTVSLMIFFFVANFILQSRIK